MTPDEEVGAWIGRQREADSKSDVRKPSSSASPRARARDRAEMRRLRALGAVPSAVGHAARDRVEHRARVCREVGGAAQRAATLRRGRCQGPSTCPAAARPRSPCRRREGVVPSPTVFAGMGPSRYPTSGLFYHTLALRRPGRAARLSTRRRRIARASPCSTCRTPTAGESSDRAVAARRPARSAARRRRRRDAAATRAARCGGGTCSSRCTAAVASSLPTARARRPAGRRCSRGMRSGSASSRRHRRRGAAPPTTAARPRKAAASRVAAPRGGREVAGEEPPPRCPSTDRVPEVSLD